MDVLSLSALPAACLLFQPTPLCHALVVVCKATFRLEPGTSPLAAEQEALLEDERPWDCRSRRLV